MRVGVVCDTHNNLKNVQRIVELFNEARVERVVHTGDITQAKTLDAFSGLRAPLYGVFGNNDAERESLEQAMETHGFHFVDPPLELWWHGRSLLVVHDPLEMDEFARDHHDLLLHGHTHLYRRELRGTQLIFNPGECAGIMPGLNAVGVVNLETLETELIKF